MLLSHHHHADNLDDAGREARASPTVVTTVAGAKQTAHPDIRGLAAGTASSWKPEGRSPSRSRRPPAGMGLR